MSATARIRALCDQSAQNLRKAVLVYANGNRRATPAIQVDPILYGDVLRHYLQWSAELLATMERVAAARPSCTAVIHRLVELAESYFQDASRWPTAAHLDHPLRLLIPAYYTVRGAQEVNSLMRPELVLVEFPEAHEFVIEILGHAVADRICQHKNSDMKSLAKVDEETSPAFEPLRYRAFLHAAQRSRLARARAPKPVVPQVAVPPRPALAPTVMIGKEKLVALSWSMDLSDRRIVIEQVNEPFGPGSYYFKETFLDLARGHRYRLRDTSSSPVSSGGLSVGGSSIKEARGEWTIKVIGDTAHLVLSDDGGGTTSYQLEKGGRNYVTLDGRDRELRSL